MLKVKYASVFFFLVIIMYSQEKVIFTQFSSGGDLNRISEEVLKTAYKRINTEIEFYELPSKRGIVESNRGNYAGEMHRVKGIDQQYSNLVMVEIPINFLELRAFSKKYDFFISSKELLKDYSVGITRGAIIIEEYTKGLNVRKYTTLEQAIKSLDTERIDFVIMSDINGFRFIKENNYTGIQSLEPVLLRINLYHYLHKDRKNLIIPLEEVLKEMKDSGEIEKIRKRILKEK